MKLPDRLIKDIINFLPENATLIDIDKAPKDVYKDPEDAKLLALAQKSGVSYLITGDWDEEIYLNARGEIRTHGLLTASQARSSRRSDRRNVERHRCSNELQQVNIRY